VPQYRRFSREEITTLADPVRCANDEDNDDDQDWEEEQDEGEEKGDEEQNEKDEEEEPICTLPTFDAELSGRDCSRWAADLCPDSDRPPPWQTEIPRNVQATGTSSPSLAPADPISNSGGASLFAVFPCSRLPGQGRHTQLDGFRGRGRARAPGPLVPAVGPAAARADAA
jgi:hypothetical protein